MSLFESVQSANSPSGQFWLYHAVCRLHHRSETQQLCGRHMRPGGEFAPAMTFYRCVANQPTRAHRQPLARPTFRTSDVRADAGRLAMERATRAPDVFGLSVAEYAALLLI